MLSSFMNNLSTFVRNVQMILLRNDISDLT